MVCEAVIFHYAPEGEFCTLCTSLAPLIPHDPKGYLQNYDLMPHPESQHPERTPIIVPDSPRSPDASSLRALSPLVTGRVTDESAGHEAHSEEHANQGDVKPPHTTQSKKRKIEVKPEVSDNDNSDVGELSLEDQEVYARIKVRLRFRI